MREVVVHPERCVGCMQCMAACAAAHSRSKSLFLAALETPQPRPRVHVAAGLYNEGFPNRCRHCDPAPCMLACLPGAIFRNAERNTVFIDPGRCINCASCAMACPFGVIRYHEDVAALPGKAIAVKCDNCIERQAAGLIPACAEVCKSGALTFEERSEAMRRRSQEVARTVSPGSVPTELSAGFALLMATKRQQTELLK